MSKRDIRNEMLRENRAIIGKLSARLTLVPLEELEAIPTPEGFPDWQRPYAVWRSRNYLVQLYVCKNDDYPGLLRLSISRCKVRPDGRFEDGLTWDELYAIKAEVGYGNWYGIEVYPLPEDLQNVQNIRHLWLLPVPLKIGFKS